MHQRWTGRAHDGGIQVQPPQPIRSSPSGRILRFLAAGNAQVTDWDGADIVVIDDLPAFEALAGAKLGELAAAQSGRPCTEIAGSVPWWKSRDAPASEAPEAAPEHTVLPTGAMLLRYCAIIFNTDRIPYDLAYAHDVLDRLAYAGLHQRAAQVVVGAGHVGEDAKLDDRTGLGAAGVGPIYGK